MPEIDSTAFRISWRLHWLSQPSDMKNMAKGFLFFFATFTTSFETSSIGSLKPVRPTVLSQRSIAELTAWRSVSVATGSASSRMPH